MTALAKAKALITEVGDGLIPQDQQYGVENAVTIFQGALLVRSADGYAKPAVTGLGLVALGFACEDVDNASGADNAKKVNARLGVGWMANSAGGDAIAVTDRLKPCYIVDDATVALTDGVGTRSRAGIIIDVDATKGVAVLVLPPAIPEQGLLGSERSVEMHFILSKGADAAILARFTPGYVGKIKRLNAWVVDPATTAAKAITVTMAIAGTPTTGGALALTSANCTPLGAKINASAITALNKFGATDELTAVGSATTAFVEGIVVMQVWLEPVAA